MRDQDKTKERLIGELVELRQRITELEAVETEHKRAEDALRESEEKFRNLAEHSPNMIFINKRGRVVYANRRCEEMMGYTTDQFYSADFDFLTLIAPEHRELVKASFGKHMKGKDIKPYEFALVTKDGRRIEALLTAKLVDHDGERAILGTVTDITERKRAEVELQAYARQQAALFQVSTDLAATLDESDVCREIVRGLHETLGYDYLGLFMVDETTGERVLSATIGWPDAPSDWRIPPGHGVSERPLLDGQLHYTPDVTRDPRYIPGLNSGAEVDVPIRIGEQVVGVLIVESKEPGAFDEGDLAVLTATANQASVALERAREHQAVKEAEARYRSLFDGVPVGISRIAPEGQILDANLSLVEMLGYPDRETLLAVNVASTYADREDWKRLQALIELEGAIRASQVRLRRYDGAIIWAESNVSAVRDADGQALYYEGTLEKITERKRVEDLLRAQRDLALQLGATVGLDETLRLCVEAAIHNTEMDAGGVYLVDETSGNLDLRYSTGLSPDFIALTSHYDADAPNTRLVMEGRPIYINYQELDVPMDEIRRNEGLCGIAILPVLHEGREIACLNIASHSLYKIPATTRDTLETIAAQIGSAIAHSKAQEALRQSEERLHRVVENMPVMMDALDEDSNIIVWNRECERVTGYSAAEMEGNLQSLEMLYPDAAYREQMVAEVVDLGLNYRNKEWTLTCKDGAKKTISWSCVSSQFPIPGWYSWAIGVDVTARKQAEEERERLLVQIQEQARRMQQIMDTVPEGVLLLKADGQVILTNPVAGRHLDILAGARTGDTLTHLGNRPLAEFLTSPPKGLWHEIAMDDRVFELIARPMENGPEPEDWVLVINDVTQQREIQQHIQHQERLASVGQLAAGIAHDFNNIMATIVLYAQMTARMEELPLVVRERMGTINQQAEHATKLIQQILDFSRRAVLERRPLDMVPLLKEHVKLLERTLPENIEIELIYEPDEYAVPLTVHADPTRMQQMVTNLAVNARDAMPNGGTLCIELEHVEVRLGESPLLPEMEAGEWIKVTVSDTGTGIPPDVLPHIFEPFFTTRAPLGSGLGLAQVHGIVGQHGGRIDVDTRLGEGTIFTIYLPALSVSEKPSTVSPKSSAPLSGQGQTVLVVEDDAILRKVLVESLRTLNYQVLGATNGQEALVMLEQHGDEIDLLLSDMVMPVMGGKALLYALRERGLTIPVVMLTGHPLKKEMEELRAQGLTDWLRKPPELEELAEVITRALGTD